MLSRWLAADARAERAGARQAGPSSQDGPDAAQRLLIDKTKRKWAEGSRAQVEASCHLSPGFYSMAP
jgi:hypothetical protein